MRFIESYPTRRSLAGAATLAIITASGWASPADATIKYFLLVCTGY